MASPYNPEFNDLFCIRDLQINWPAIAAAGSCMSLIKLSRSGPLTLKSAFVAWHTRYGEPVLLPERGDTAVTLEQAATPGFTHPRMYEDRISYHIQQGRFDWTLPAYDVQRGYLLLNGAH